jgi:tellurite resistance protein
MQCLGLRAQPGRTGSGLIPGPSAGKGDKKVMTIINTGKSAHARFKRLDLDEALIALFIGAMDANDHVAREELARAHHLIWSTKRFRRKSGETVGRVIARMKKLLEEQDPSAVMEAAARSIPAKLRPSAFAIVADLLLADGGRLTHENGRSSEAWPSTSTSGLAWRATSSTPCSSRIISEGDTTEGTPQASLNAGIARSASPSTRRLSAECRH